MKIEKICILGGGTAGFSMACLLARYKELSENNLDITVVYSSEIGNIGVGESTLLSINDLFGYLNLKDEEWMPQCDATYKTSIAFENFYKKGNQFHYPFGFPVISNPAYPSKWFELNHHYPDIFSNDTYAKYMIPATRMNEKNKLTDREDIPGFNFSQNSAYHFDTHKLAKVFKNYAEERGVKFIDDLYTESVVGDDGNIKKLICSNHTIEADLFIDCSGFKSLLLNKVMGAEFIDFNETLINNRVVRAKIPYTDKEKQLKNYTNCVALDNGWCWEIPLWDCLSVGYVHSLKFATEEEILAEFKNHCLKHGIEVDEKDIDIINYKTGRHNKGWIKNVIGVGLSYGFLEPLESTGILTLLHNGFRAIEFLSKRNLHYTNVDRDIFNYSVGKEIDTLRGFIECHYAFSSRDDSDYWKYVTNDINYPNEFPSTTLAEASTYFELMYKSVITRNYFDYQQPNSGGPFIMAGMNYNCYSNAFMLAEEKTEELEASKDNFLKEDEILNDLVDSYPSTHEFLKERIYK